MIILLPNATPNLNIKGIYLIAQPFKIIFKTGRDEFLQYATDSYFVYVLKIEYVSKMLFLD